MPRAPRVTIRKSDHDALHTRIAELEAMLEAAQHAPAAESELDSDFQSGIAVDPELEQPAYDNDMQDDMEAEELNAFEHSEAARNADAIANLSTAVAALVESNRVMQASLSQIGKRKAKIYIPMP